MPKLPQLSGKEVERILVRLGFLLKSQKGSHMKFVREQGEREIIVVPNHKALRKGTLHGILKKLNMQHDDLKKLMK